MPCHPIHVHVTMRIQKKAKRKSADSESVRAWRQVNTARVRNEEIHFEPHKSAYKQMHHRDEAFRTGSRDIKETVKGWLRSVGCLGTV